MSRENWDLEMLWGCIQMYTGPAGTVTPAAAVGNATTVDDIVEDFNVLLANLRDAGLLER